LPLLEVPLASTVLLFGPSCRASWPTVLLPSAPLLEVVDEAVGVEVVVPAVAEEVPGRPGR
jgi:hypothetical protein